MAAAIFDKVKERRKRVLVGQLPDDFLRISVAAPQQEAADRLPVVALHQNQAYISQTAFASPAPSRLNITVQVVQAKLAKNYGITRMDPYCRLRVGHYVYETHTATNGGKAPRWNKIVQCVLPQGIKTITVEIYDECSFTIDTLIAWATIVIPKKVLAGETHEDWYPLSGKQGEGEEGMINLILSYSMGPAYYVPNCPIMEPRDIGTIRQQTALLAHTARLRMYAPPYYQITHPAVISHGAVVPQVLPIVPVLSESELKQIEEMFPSIGKEVIKTVFEANKGSKEGTINSLLQMSVN